MITHEYYIKNEVFNAFLDAPINIIKPAESENMQVITSKTEFLDLLHKNYHDIYEKKYGNISAFNFKRDVFFSGKWNDLSKIARGLFLDNRTGEVIARGYEKFFNFNERPFNTLPWLKNNLKFPVTVYKKYNGYLGLLGYDETKETGHKLIFCSKSSPESDYADNFRRIFSSQFNNTANAVEEIESYLSENNLCLIFEVIDPIADPHIIKYEKEQIVLLAAIKRQIKFEELNYEDLCKLGDGFNWKVKEIDRVINSFEELELFMNSVLEDMSSEIEGFVLEDMNKYMFKLKGGYYKMWKYMRKIKDDVANGRTFSQGGLQNPEMNYFLAWLKRQDKEFLKNTDIITCRELFKNEK